MPLLVGEDTMGLWAKNPPEMQLSGVGYVIFLDVMYHYVLELSRSDLLRVTQL